MRVTVMARGVSKAVRRRGAHFLCVAAAALLTGCTALTSDPAALLEKQGRAPEGIHYYLPKMVVGLTLSVDAASAVFTVAADPGTWIADTELSYYLRHTPLPHYEDTIQVQVTPKGFLKQVSSNTTDDTIQIVEQLAKLFGALNQPLESASSKVTATQLARISVDPSDDRELARAARFFNQEVRKFARAQQAKCNLETAGAMDKEAGFILDVQKRALCKAYERVLSGGTPVAMAFAPLHDLPNRCRMLHGRHHDQSEDDGERVGLVAPRKHANCTEGICYRPAKPHELCIKVGDAIKQSIYEVPNSSEVVEIDIRRAFLVNKMQVIDFDQTSGLMTGIRVQKGSELLALSSLPLTVLNAISAGIQLRIDIVHQEAAVAKASTSLIHQRAALEKKRHLVEAAAKASAETSSAASISTVPRAQQSGASATQSAGSPFDLSKTLN